MTQYLSDKLRVLSFVSILLVLYIHSSFHENEINGMEINIMTQDFISGMVGRCAVPLFYIISGWLFFRKCPDGVLSVWRKMKKRVRTLLVPYLIGCLLCVCVSVAIAVLPGVSKYMNGNILPLFNESMGNIVCSVFYAGDTGMPVAYQLWFLRDLLLVIATAPLWYYALRYLRWAFVAVVFALTFFNIPNLPVFALFWFVLGGQLASVNVESCKFIRGGNSCFPCLSCCAWRK